MKNILVHCVAVVRLLLIVALPFMSSGVYGKDLVRNESRNSDTKQQSAGTNQFFLEEEMSDGGSRSFGKYYVCVFLKSVESHTYVSFEIYYPDSDQVVFAEHLPVGEERSTDGGKVLKFQFVDNWGNKGSGVIRDQRGSVMVIDLTPTLVVADHRGRNATRQYGDYEVGLGDCRPSTRKLHISAD